MREIKGTLYKITTTVTKKVKYVECKNSKELIRYIVRTDDMREPLSVVEIKKNGNTPKVAVYTDKYYKKLIREDLR